MGRLNDDMMLDRFDGPAINNKRFKKHTNSNNTQKLRPDDCQNV